MVIYEDESLVIPVGLGNNSTDDSKLLQAKNVTITENTTTQVTPDSNYIGLSRVSITTDVPTEIHNQQKDEVVHANTSMTIYPDSGYTGLSRVNVTAKADLQDKFAKISQGGVTNITYDEGFDGLNSVEVFVDVPLGKIEFDSSTNAQRVVTDSSGYCDITVNPYTVKDIYVDSSTSPQVIRPTVTDAFNNIYINQLSLDPLNINPSKKMQVFQGAYDFVQVHPVTSSIDSNIVPENIRKDTTILGVRGTLEAIGEKEELTVDSSTSTQVYTPSEGSAGFSKVTVEPYALDSKTVKSSTVRQIVTSDEDGLSSVTVEPYTLESRTVDAGIEDKIITPMRSDALSSVKVNKVTSNIDSNIIPENIRKDTTILGVTGTLEAIGKTEELIVDSSTSTQVYTPQEGNVGFSKVTVNGYTANYASLFEQVDANTPYVNLYAGNLMGLKTVGTYAFSGNRYRNITLPNTVIALSEHSFSNGNYESIDMSNINTYKFPNYPIKYSVIYDSTVKSITFPNKMNILKDDGIWFIMDQCKIDTIDLRNCINLHKISRLISNSNVKTIYIPASVTVIDYLAYECEQLDAIYCYATTPPIVSSLVSNVKQGGTLHVPIGSYDAYINSNWTSKLYGLGNYNWTVVEDL